MRKKIYGSALIAAASCSAYLAVNASSPTSITTLGEVESITMCEQLDKDGKVVKICFGSEGKCGVDLGSFGSVQCGGDEFVRPEKPVE
ncbi:MAG: hypothetical protein HDS00_05660 [Bacteroides sp.]|nr:hypothetical protein [Bacteroides sp.]